MTLRLVLNSSFNGMGFPTIKLREHGGETITDDFGLRDHIPQGVQAAIVRVSIKTWLPPEARRESGIYKGKDDAAAEVDSAELLAWGTKLESVRALHDQIRAGQIRPTESWEATQVGKSKEELISENAGYKEISERALTKLEEIDKIVTWQGSWWPLVWKSTIRSALAAKK